MDLAWILVGGSSLDTRMEVSTRLCWGGGEEQVLDNVRSRNMVRTHPAIRESHWSCPGFRLFVDRRSVDVSIYLHKAKVSCSQTLGYVPYQMWAEADPRITTLLRNSMRSSRHELLVSNFKGIPIMQQHGSADDNVPAFHSRRMNQLTSQMNGEFLHRYVELKGKSHWFDGVMTTAPLLGFYDILEREADWPKLPQEFTIVIANPAEMGARGGLLVDQLISPDQLGKIEVERRPISKTWVLRTSNILRFHFIANQNSEAVPHQLVIDQYSLELPPGKEKFDCWLIRFKQGLWHVRIFATHSFGPAAHYLRYLTIVSGLQSNVTARNWDPLTRFFAAWGDF